MDTNGLDWLAILFAVVGALAWGVLGVTGLMGDPMNIVTLALEPVFRPGPAELVENVIYVLVGLSGLYLLYTAYKMGRASRRTTREARRRDAAATGETATTGDTAGTRDGAENNS